MRYLTTWMILLVTTAAYGGHYELLRFRADWCKPCIQQKEIFAAAKIATTLKQNNVKDVDLDADMNPNAVKAWQVKSLPTTIIIWVDDEGAGHERNRKVGVMQAPAYRKFVTP